MPSVSLTSPSDFADSVRTEVRDHYAELVRSQNPCCSPTCCATDAIGAALYSSDELAAVPNESATVSYGCGNPTAIAGLLPGEVVLDLGSGGGIDVFLASDKVGAEGFVYGVDMTDEMLDLARRSADRLGRTNVEFRKGVIEQIPIPDNTVDVIISNCVLNLSPDKPAALREAFRVLKPGGRVAISDIVIEGDLSDLPISEEQIRSALDWAGCVAGALTVTELRRTMADAGLVDVSIEPRSHFALDDLGPVAHDILPRAVGEALAARFVSADIRGRKP